MSTVHPLFTALINDAALFPPGSATMAAAVAADPRHRSAPYADVVGRFLCPASRIGELIEELPEGATLGLGIVADTGLAGLPDALAQVAADDRLTLEAVEIAPSAELELLESVTADLDAMPPVMAFVELSRTAGWQRALGLVAAAGRGAKLRIGGASAAMFPTEAEVVDFIAACADRDVPFTCSAGLPRAVRHCDPDTGFEQHGFLNIALASYAAVIGEGRPSVERLLGERDADELVRIFGHITDHDARRTRSLFVGYGSRSIEEPVRDLTDLGLL